MANPGFYNDNEFRDYPFTTKVLPLEPAVVEVSSESMSLSLSADYHVPHAAIVDFGAIMEIDSDYSEFDGHSVYLYEISRVGTVFTFRFRTTAPYGANHEVVFTRDSATASEFLVEYADASAIVGEPVDPLSCEEAARWSAFMISGHFETLSDLLPSGDSFTYPAGYWQIEPSRIRSLKDSYLRACNLGNFQRTLATPPPECSFSSSEGARDGPYITALCIDGDIEWKEGYNCTIRQDTRENAIIIGAGIGSGDGEPCEEVPVYEGEAPPAGSPHLSGGPGCSQIVKTINGIGGRNVQLTAGSGFRVYSDTDGTLVIDKALDDFALCLGDEEAVSSSLSLDSE